MYEYKVISGQISVDYKKHETFESVLENMLQAMQNHYQQNLHRHTGPVQRSLCLCIWMGAKWLGPQHGGQESS